MKKECDHCHKEAVNPWEIQLPDEKGTIIFLCDDCDHEYFGE